MHLLSWRCVCYRLAITILKYTAKAKSKPREKKEKEGKTGEKAGRKHTEDK